MLSASFSPDGRRVVTASADRTAQLWDAFSGRPLTESMRHSAGVRSAEFSPDGRLVATVSSDKTARVWDARTGQPLTDPLRHDAWVRSVQFSPDGRRVLTASDDKTARIWDTLTGSLMNDPLRHAAATKWAQFSADGQLVVTASDDNTARVWHVFPPVSPVPEWFLDWAEAWVNSPFSDRGGVRVVPHEARQKIQESVAARTDSSFYTRIAQWLQADPAIRPPSPFADLSVHATRPAAE